MNLKVLLHLAGWLVFIYSEERAFLLSEWELMDYMNSLSLHATRILTFYLAYFYIWPKYLRMDKIPQLLLGITLAFLFFPAFRYFIDEFLFLHLFGEGNFTNPTSWFYLNNNLWWYALPIISTSALVFLFEKSQRDKESQLLLQREKTKAELAYLRSQVNPHFLFNTLHFLHTEAFQVSPPLADTILKVSDILRYSVESTKEGKRTIAKEVELINNYIDIFKMRYENQCFVNFHISGEESHQLIEPLLLIPFVENAFKHGQFSNPSSPINISLAITKGHLNFHVTNAIKKQKNDPGHGIGVANVKRRLEVLYPAEHQLNITADADNHNVVLTLSL